MNIQVQGFVLAYIFIFFLGKYLGVQWLGHREGVCLTF